MNKAEVTNIVLAGVGGQGILLASEIIAQAAIIAGHEVKTNEVHGMAQRGGSVIAQIRYGKEVHSPLVAMGSADVLVGLEKIEGLRYHSYLKPEGVAIISSQTIVPVTVSTGGAVYPEDAEARLRQVFPRLVYLDAAKLAQEAGNLKTANVAIIGAVSKALDLPTEAWNAAMEKCVKPQYFEVNLRAYELGRNFNG
ncbi:MAG: indolepyruvate oxidoreductase subunit beta [Planctomycetes bacterium]|nr:indolepyruvate oxidoreductase subunit beta [Planctomycetota bacterium]